MSNTIVRPSGDRSSDIQLPLLVSIRSWRAGCNGSVCPGGWIGRGDTGSDGALLPSSTSAAQASLMPSLPLALIPAPG